MEHTINLIMGDYSNDGHEKREHRTIRSNLTIKELQEAYNIGAEKIGVDLVADVCEEYEDNSLSKKDYNKFVVAGFKDKLSLYKNKYQIWHDDFVKLYLFTCSIGNPDLKYEFISGDNFEIYIGGYGLFT